MKRLSFIFSCVLSCCCLFAQDAQKIALSAYVSDKSGVPAASKKILESKLTNVITASGFGAEANQRFILTARVNILTEDVTETAPAQYAYTLSIDLFIGDGVSGTLFSSTQIETKGVGVTKDKAYAMALKSLSPRTPAMRQFVASGKEKIIDYYALNGSAILKKAETLAANQKFEEAIYELSVIPQACSDFYYVANDMIADIYTKQIDQEGANKLAAAKAIWNASQDRESAERAGGILALINPQSSAFKEAEVLHHQIAERVKALDAREWNFKLQVHKDEVDLQKAQINAARDVAVAWAENQPQPVYNIIWW